MFNICLGHHTRYNHALLIYQLICAGFDCKNISCAVYLGQIGVILRKKTNGLQRISSAITESERIWDGNKGLANFFPFDIRGGRKNRLRIN
jgi:hypothetical protein